jgi:Asp-tRNA(Asn)/Glu-tRNA(Gln) amidotransferase A subunit family amidase
MTMLIDFALCVLLQQEPAPPPPKVTVDQVREAGRVIGFDFTEDELKLMLGEVSQALEAYPKMQAIALDNSVPPAIGFSPLVPGVSPHPWKLDAKPIVLPDAQRPENLDDLAFANIPTLAALVKSRKVSCVELANLFIGRLERANEKLACVVTFTKERALAKAKALDAELAQGKWRGMLHGIPYGAKDLLAAKGYRTTWGAKAFENQTIDLDATVIRKLDDAGAVLIAKTTLGELAYGDVWFGGTTKNPWKPDEGSSGSSAGSCAATAAGCLPFAIGSETLGSIVSPSDRCGCSSLRPTFGRVSRTGAMALSWTMDKLGPICRSVEDASIVFDAIRGGDGVDTSVIEQPYVVPGPVDVRGFKVGYLKSAFEEKPPRRPNQDPDEPAPGEAATHVLDELRALGVELVPIELPKYPSGEMLVILTAEAATAFDDLTRSGRDETMVRQTADAWPNLFRAARLIPAVEYLRANRLRTQLARDVDKAIAGLDAYVHPSFGGDSILITNLTGQPTVVAPSGFRKNGTPRSISFTGQLFGETRLLALAQAWQRSTHFHEKHPTL